MLCGLLRTKTNKASSLFLSHYRSKSELNYLVIMSTITNVSSDVDVDQIKSFRDFLMSYNKLSELCFIDCVWDFTSRTVKSQEDKCALNCMEKFLKLNQRISQRFQEFQIIANENAIASTKKR